MSVFSTLATGVVVYLDFCAMTSPDVKTEAAMMVPKRIIRMG